MRRRKPKESDQENVEKALKLLSGMIADHSEIEITLWYSAFMSAFVEGHIQTGFSYEQFLQVLGDIGEDYKIWFDIDCPQPRKR